MTVASNARWGSSIVSCVSERLGLVRRARRHDLLIALGAVATTLVAIRVLGASWRGGFAPAFPDSASYLKVAKLGPFRLSFWFGERPIVVPALYWMLGRNVRLIVLAQTTLALGVGWWAIVSTWRRCHSHIARWGAVALIAALAVQSRFVLWTTQILSESLSMTLGTAAVLAWLGLVTVWFGAVVLPGRRERFLGGAVVGALAALVALHALNPDAFIARHNLARAREGLRFDVSHFLRLGPDAAPILIREMNVLPAEDQKKLREEFARRWPATDTDWRHWNLARARARAAVAAIAVPPK